MPEQRRSTIRVAAATLMKPADKPPHRWHVRLSAALVVAAALLAGGVQPLAADAERASVPDEDVLLRSLRRADVRQHALEPDLAFGGVDGGEHSAFDRVHAGIVSTERLLIFVARHPLPDVSIALSGALVPRAAGARAPPPSGQF